MNLDELDLDLQARVKAAAEIRRQSVEEILLRYPSPKALNRIPPRFGELAPTLIGQAFSDSGQSAGMPYVVTPNGRIFYGHASRNNLIRAFEFIQDLCSPNISKETCGVAMEVSFRYLTDSAWYPTELLPKTGGTIVEVGAYCGHKTIKFIDKVVGTGGKILAIEMMPDNMEILRRNVVENNLENSIDLVEAGAWNKAGHQMVVGKGFQQNSLVHIDGREFKEIKQVPTKTLDDILSNWGETEVDFLDIRVNGAEIEVIEGLNQSLDRVKVIFVATPYSRSGTATHNICLKLLQEKGCSILPQSRQGIIYAVTPKFADQFLTPA